MREKFVEPAGGLCREALKDVFEIAMRIVAVQFGRLDETHDSRRALASPQGSCEEPVVSVMHGRS